MLKEQIINLAKEIQQADSAVAQAEYRALETFVDKAIAYVGAVARMESQVEILRFRYDAETYRTEVERLDRGRRLTHNSFISCIDVINRICAAHEMPAIYNGKDDREAKGDFAFKIVDGFCNHRLKEVLE